MLLPAQKNIMHYKLNRKVPLHSKSSFDKSAGSIATARTNDGNNFAAVNRQLIDQHFG